MTEGYTVAQLIKALQDLPQDWLVYDDCCEAICEIHLIGNEQNPFLPNEYVQLKTYYDDPPAGMEPWED